MQRLRLHNRFTFYPITLNKDGHNDLDCCNCPNDGEALWTCSGGGLYCDNCKEQFEKDNISKSFITPAQLYYIVNVYPEEVSLKEAIKVFKKAVKNDESLLTYYKSAARILEQSILGSLR